MPAPLRPLAEDTSLEAEALLLEHYRALDVPARMAIVREFTKFAEQTAVAAIRERHPGATEREVRLRLAALKYGREQVPEAFGWDPLVEGW